MLLVHCEVWGFHVSSVQDQVFWNMTLRGWFGVRCWFRGMQCFQLQWFIRQRRIPNAGDRWRCI